ncbi:hypothetical protein EO763_21545 [Pectobacterium odoriferum]|uniref:hypothetical protein n=1 Tax=Pectobacterium odoriferum TaxID=78398 RepID=UPI001374454B|nr:hypothetical protein [Pectobacterium odoriferum]QHP82268.1 hypothetical protein EO763_21545 [Pectobacterium odoriferum]GKW04575.1 hypothetical protein PEC301877_33880 [Pectobacterium carotovorum subsp. carotovorum]
MNELNSFDNSNVRIFTLYWNNVDLQLVNAQREVFEKFGFKIEQHNYHGMDHGIWMEGIFNAAADEDVIIIVDIDCIPLNSNAVKKAIISARNGKVFGCAQSANHIDYHYIYAGPMFLSLTGKTWRDAGKPSLQADDEFDVGGRLTDAAQQAGHLPEFVYPSDVAVPKWLIGEKYICGLFTIYEHSYLHLFESRNKDLIDCFIEMSNDIISSEGEIDYRKYIIRASNESHDRYVSKYLSKKSIIGKISREFKRVARKLNLKK